MRIKVAYPSGKRFVVEGAWHGPKKMLPHPNQLGTEADVVGVDTGREVLLLDPRGRYTDADTGVLLYDGGQHGW